MIQNSSKNDNLESVKEKWLQEEINRQDQNNSSRVRINPSHGTNMKV